MVPAIVIAVLFATHRGANSLPKTDYQANGEMEYALRDSLTVGHHLAHHAKELGYWQCALKKEYDSKQVGCTAGRRH
jgi:hypothetical protein